MATSKPTRETVQDKKVRGALAKVHTNLLCCVVSYDKDTQTATLEPCAQFKRMSPKGEIEAYAPPLLVNVPVYFPKAVVGGDTFSFTYPVSAGDTALVFFSERSVDEWKAGSTKQTAPASNRRFDLSDGFALVGFSSPSSPLSGDAIDEDGPVIKAPKVTVVSTDVRLGSDSATDYVALSSLVLSELQTIQGKLNALITWYNTNVAITVANLGVPTTAISPASVVSETPYSASAVAATKVKAE